MTGRLSSFSISGHPLGQFLSLVVLGVVLVGAVIMGAVVFWFLLGIFVIGYSAFWLRSVVALARAARRAGRPTADRKPDAGQKHRLHRGRVRGRRSRRGRRAPRLGHRDRSTCRRQRCRARWIAAVGGDCG